jgi:formylglycine-generating enzyme required for sulfatase activity
MMTIQHNHVGFVFAAEVLLFLSPARGQPVAPVVSDVRAAQRADASRLVDIHYDLSHNAPCTVWPVVSGDGGVSWNVPAMTLTGDFGPNVAPGLNKHIVWDAGRDIPGILGTFRARIYADDGQSSSNMVVVPAGTFPYQRNFAQQIFVGTFLIDKYEVTNLRYAEFLNDADPDGTYWNGGMEITRSGTPPDVYYAVYPGRENYPIRYVSALDAEAYAAWLSAHEGRTYRLPTEQEWEKVAAWDPTINKHWQYGFQSDSISCQSANFYNGSNYCVGNVSEVGHYDGTNGTNNARSFYGCYDMSGNVLEWTGSGCDPNCRVLRGGSWGYGAADCQTTTSNVASPTSRSAHFGFRLALEP